MGSEGAIRLRRSVLFTPGSRPDRVQKAIENRTADVVVADLEDAVGPDDKASARDAVCSALAAVPRKPQGPERWVRVNQWQTPWAVPDLEAVVLARPDAVVVPKAGRWAELVALDVTLSRLERRHDVSVGSTQVVAILETAHGVETAAKVARAPRVTALAFGAEDLAADIGLKRTKSSEEVFTARSRVALAAGAAGVDAIDQVFVDIDDTDAILAEASFARNLGYRGKMVIHPRQVAPVHTAFSPSPQEVADAERLLSAVEGAEVGAGGVLRFEGRMIDVPLIQQARRILAEARAATAENP